VALLDGGKKVKSRCGQCGKIGHTKKDGWEKPKNKNLKKPRI
jgi:hypothetical protein